MEKKYDLLVVGGGVLGTFHAYHALQKGYKVVLLEKDSRPVGATVRNFGQVVPSGMNSKWQEYGRESLAVYKSIQSEVDITVRQNGSVYLASDEQEQLLLEELHHINRQNDYTSHLLTKAECLQKYPGLREDYVKSGLFFPEEVTVEPLQMVHRVQEYLKNSFAADIFFSTPVTRCDSSGEEVIVYTATGIQFRASKVIICNGSDFQLLYPGLFAAADMEVTKLQMLQTVPQKGLKLRGGVLTGLSIRRYEAFRECPSYAAIKAEEDCDSPEKKWGVHLLFKQAADGSVIIGDSHEYAAVTAIENLGYHIDEGINRFLLAEARKIFDLPSYDIRYQWFGMYAQCRTGDIFQHTIDNNIHIVTAIGGKGMTASPGFAAEHINQLL